MMNQDLEEINELHFRTAVELLPHGLLIVDRKGYILLANKEAERIFGYGLEELLHRPFEILIPKRYWRAQSQFGKDSLKKPTILTMGMGVELFGMHKNGSEIPIEICLNPAGKEEGSFVVVSVLDIKESKRAEKLFRTAIESAPSGMVIVDASGSIMLVNREIERVFGYAREELLGQSIEILVPQRFRSNHPHYRAEFFTHPSTRRMGGGRDLFGLRKDGTEIPVEIGLNPIQTDRGLLVLSVIVDITDRKRAEESLQAANRELTDFAMIVSHDLKTPLRAVSTLAKWMQSDYAEKLDKEGRENLDEMVQRVGRMDRMIDDILTYSRLGLAEEKRELVALADLVGDVVQDLCPPARVHINISEGLPVVSGDPVRLHQLFQNLIGNAIKYGDKPQTEIRVERTDCRTFWQFSVADNGPGIEERHFERIFKIFQTLAPKDKTNSMGVGLALVKRIVERGGGRVWLESRMGQGSTFHFTWPKADI